MARVARQIAPRTVVKALFAPLKIEYEPPEAYVEYPGNAKGACCISVDFDVTSPERYKPNQAGTLALLDLSDRFDVPLTWAVCGKDAEKDSATYLKIRQADTCQEIGVHTYSHLDASTCSAAELEADIQHCIQVLDLRSTPKVFVFPWNREGHFETIRRIGFMTYRGKRRAIAPPRKENSLWNIAPVFYLDQKSLGAFSLLRRYLDFCVSSRTVFHLWLHPWSIIVEEDSQKMIRTTLHPLFNYINERQASGELAVCTMGSLAEHFEAAG